MKSLIQRGAYVLLGVGLATLVSFAPWRAAAPLQGQGGQGGGQGDDTGSTQAPQVLPGLSAIGTADSNNRMIAVTGIDLTGSAVLYVIDTENPHIAVYQAQGGSSGSQGIKLVAARNVSLDLQLDGFNDQSQYSFKELQKKFLDAELLSQQPAQK